MSASRPPIITVDVGTTWAKLAVYDCAGPEPQLRDTLRIPSGLGEFDGSREAVARFLALCEQLETALAECLVAAPTARVGLTSIREGLVLLDGVGEVLWVSGNALLDDPRLLPLPISRAVVAHVLPEVLALQPGATRLLSVPGYLAWRLTGRPAVTASELSALGLWTAEDRPAAGVTPLLAGVELAAPGASVGPCRAHPAADVFLAGTDEQASHHGAGVGIDGAWGLATATFWSLTAPAGPEPPALPPEVRYLPALPPYHANVSVIGYRWGPYLQEALAGECPVIPERLPLWAAGELLEFLRGGGPVDRVRLLQAAAADIRAGIELLAQVGHAPPPTALRVHGGGVTGLGSFAWELLQEVGLPWVEVPGDATQLGCCLVGMERS